MNQQQIKKTVEDSVLQGIFGAVRSYQFGHSREPLSRIEEAVQKALPNLEERKVLAARLIELLEGDSTDDAKKFACLQLAVLDATTAVPALSKLLGSERQADMAIHALESITDLSAGKTLRDALDTTEGLVRIGVINALGKRQDHPAVTALGALLLDNDAMTSEAAARALGMIRGTSAYMALTKALPKVSSGTRQRIGDALLACAEDLILQKKLHEAEWIYSQLHSDSESAPVRKAAQLGLERIKG